jgi:hypothetical protein
VTPVDERLLHHVDQRRLRALSLGHEERNEPSSPQLGDQQVDRAKPRIEAPHSSAREVSPPLGGMLAFLGTDLLLGLWSCPVYAEIRIVGVTPVP